MIIQRLPSGQCHFGDKKVLHSGKRLVDSEKGVMDEMEIYRAANQRVKRYGENPGIEAAMRADAMIEQGDPEGLAVWKRILNLDSPNGLLV